MKKWILFAVITAALLIPTGCGQSSPAISIPDSALELGASHIVSGQEAQWTVKGEEVDALKEWVADLRYRSVSFKEGETPGDSDGGEVYRFDAAEYGDPGFSYVINGPEDCWLLAEGNWYAVSNPSDPPVTEPLWEKLTVEKVKELAKKGEDLSWSDFEPFRHVDIGTEPHVYFYDMDESYCLVIGGEDTKTAPRYVRLVLKPYDHLFADDTAYIDVRTESIEDFIMRAGDG